MSKLAEIKAIFAEASKLVGAEREAYLSNACQSNTALRMEVERLLASHDGSGPQIVTSEAQTRAAGMSRALEGPGHMIGRYKLLQEIGQGGFGVVFMAEQQEPVRRRVALKIVKLGMDTKQVLARFEAERQALAMMEHPNIARVLDAGARLRPAGRTS